MKKLMFSSLLTCLAAFSCLTSHAGQPATAPVVSLKDSVTARCETQHYIWIGTQSKGLYMIKKKNGKVFHITRANSIFPSDSITSMTTNEKGEVYIGTQQGMVRYDNYAFLLIQTDNSDLTSNKINSLLCPDGVQIFAGTADGTLTVFTPAGSRHYKGAVHGTAHLVAIEQGALKGPVAVYDNEEKYSLQNQQLVQLNLHK